MSCTGLKGRALQICKKGRGRIKRDSIKVDRIFKILCIKTQKEG